MSIVLLMANILLCDYSKRIPHIYLDPHLPFGMLFLDPSFLTGQPFSPRLEGKVRTAGFTVTWGNHACSFLN